MQKKAQTIMYVCKSLYYVTLIIHLFLP